MWRLFAFMVCAGFAAMNVVLYMTPPEHSPVNIGGAIFCGALAAWNLVMAVMDR